MAASPIKPWSITVDEKKEPQETRVRFKLDPSKAPWRQRETTFERQPTPVPRDEARSQERRHAPIPRDEARFYEPGVALAPLEKQAAPEKRRAARLLRTENYAAVEATNGDFGLIDNGSDAGGCKPLLVHVPRREAHPWRILNTIRPGVMLRIRTRKGGAPQCVRVRYTTPARYYAPGTRVSTLAIGVDSTDWRCLAAEASHI